MTLFLLSASVFNVALQILIYRRTTPSGTVFSGTRDAAVISGALWLLIAAGCVMQLWRPE